MSDMLYTAQVIKHSLKGTFLLSANFSFSSRKNVAFLDFDAD
jgi:hypothetical protein